MLRNYAFALSVLVGLFTLVGFVAGGYTFLDQRYALASEHNFLESRVSIHELHHLYRKAMEDMFFYRSQARIYPTDDKIKLKLEEVTDSCEKIKDQISKMEDRRQLLKLQINR